MILSSCRVLCIVLALPLISVNTFAFDHGLNEVIYETDSRGDLSATNIAPWQIEMASSTALLIDKLSVTTDETSPYSYFNTEKFGDYIWENPNGEPSRMCHDEAFFEQRTAVGGMCSGFLLGPDILVTAGHCIPDNETCNDTTFVFDFNSQTKISWETAKVKKTNVYQCKKLIKAKTSFSGIDYAIVRLDRTVEGRKPLAYRKVGRIENGASLTMLGHPMSLPLKIANGNVISNSLENVILTDLDAYAGNSGSPVLSDSGSHVVEGILINGEQDFQFDEKMGCFRSAKCTKKSCRGEEVVRISALVPFLNDLNQPKKIIRTTTYFKPKRSI